MTRASEIEEQAALWFARRDARNQPSETTEFAAWLAADARHRAAYLRLAAAWERSACLKALRPEGTPVNAELFARGGAPSRWTRWRQPLALAAGVATLAFAMGWWALANRGGETYRTEVGGLSRVVLKDGSMVILNTDTELRVRLGESRREVELLQGEAQFTVAHDTSRPFEVSAGGRLVRAVGTAFDVRLGDDEAMEVLVTEGRVAFVDTSAYAAIPGGSAGLATISAGESATAGGGKVTVRSVSATETSRHLAWQVGELSFQGETLTEAVAEFNRYNRRKLKVEDLSIGGLQIGGNFQALDVDSFIAALGRSFGITAKTADDGTLLLEPPRSPVPH
jgi:transmembrane sensor